MVGGQTPFCQWPREGVGLYYSRLPFRGVFSYGDVIPMLRGPVALALLCFVLCSVVAPSASAQYEVEQDSSVWLRALLDVRIARGGVAPSWTDFGPGKPRFGGESGANGFEHKTRFVLGQLAIEAGAALPWDVRAQAQINIQPDIADSYTPWLIDAFLRREWGERANGW